MEATKILKSVLQWRLVNGPRYADTEPSYVRVRRSDASLCRNLPMTRNLAPWVSIILIAFGLTTASVDAFARAGGGGGRGATVHLIVLLVLLPLYMIYAHIVAYIIRKKHRQCAELLQRLEQGDASWNLERIERRVKRMYFKVQEAWMQRDQSIAQEFMSDELYEKHKMQTDLMRSEHRKNVLENIDLIQARVVKVEDDVDDSKDCIWVYIKGSMIDYMVDDQTGERISGDRSRTESFAELWKLVRGKTGWVLDEIEQGVDIFALSERSFSQASAFLHEPPKAVP